MVKTIPELLDDYGPIIIMSYIFILVVTMVSLICQFSERQTERANALSIQMAARGYCLRAVVGSNELQYQPCQVKEY